MENANITITEQGHKGVVLTGKVMGATGLRIALDPEMRNQIRAEFDSWSKKYNQ